MVIQFWIRAPGHLNRMTHVEGRKMESPCELLLSSQNTFIQHLSAGGGFDIRHLSAGGFVIHFF
jgi:hypothetical protein